MNQTIEVQYKQIVLGSITGVYGVKGWVKLYSYTTPIDNILNYKHWILRQNTHQKKVAVNQGRRQGKFLIAHILGCNDRDIARQYTGAEIAITKNELPNLADDEIYWYQLEGLNVNTVDKTGSELLLGKTSHLMRTGANDILVIKASKGSIDRRERLIPWLIDQVILEVNSDGGFIRIAWNPDF